MDVRSLHLVTGLWLQHVNRVCGLSDKVWSILKMIRAVLSPSRGHLLFSLRVREHKDPGGHRSGRRSMPGNKALQTVPIEPFAPNTPEKGIFL